MRTRTSMLRAVFLIAALAALVACSNSNSNAPQLDSTGKHPANWVAQHGEAATVSTSSCTECHGADLAGGVTRVGCFSTPQTSLYGFVCHAVSPATNPGCSSCHNTPPDSLQPAGNIAPNRQFAHDTHLALANVTCDYCHFDAGFSTTNHAKATAGGGIAGATVSFLNVSSLSAKTTRPGSPGYDAASGVCSNVICHGGKPTPSFRTGSINVDTDCLTCHEQGTAPQTPQYNSFYSGSISFDNGVTTVNLHKLHLLLNDPTTAPATPIFCTNCHNTTTLASQHFAGLDTPAFEGSAANTIGGGSTEINAYTPFSTAVPSGSCTTVCHVVRNWIN